jgi:hypothetical protein
LTNPTGPSGGGVEMPDDPFVKGAVRVAVHVRRHLPLYAIGLAVLLVVALVPTVGSGDHGVGTGSAASAGASPGGGGSQGASSGGAGSSDQSGSVGGAPGSAGALPGGSVGGSSGSPSGGGGTYAPGAGATGGGSTGQPIGQVHVGSGKTVAGFACAPGTRQIPWSEYAAPCQAAFTGNNGGTTSRGITGSSILIADRDCPQSANSQAANQFAASAGSATPATIQAVAQVFIDYFNKTFDLYGRHVVLKTYPVSGSSTQCTLEAESQGQDNACADADGIANTMHAFGEDGMGIYSMGGGPGGSQPVSDCAAHQKVIEFQGLSYFPESWYDQDSPYVWNSNFMACQRVAYEVGEALSKEIMGKNAQWSGDALTQAKKRVLGTYVPNNPGYQTCVKVYDQYLQKNGFSDGYAFNYVLDISRFADQASQAIVQFHAEGVTTVILACDPISPIFLTEEADAQHYFPEWYNIGVAGNDIDTVPRLWDAKEITGHLIGLSQLGPTQAAVGPLSEPGITYQKITGKTIPMGTSGDYYPLLSMFNQLQAAGPDLTPANLAKGTWSLPPGGSPVAGGTKFAFPVGYWCYCSNYMGGAGEDHTTVEDSREIYWDNAGKSPYDGKTGTYIQLWSGARFRVGQFPTGSPPFYPSNCNPQCATLPPDVPPPSGPHDGG